MEFTKERIIEMLKDRTPSIEVQEYAVGDVRNAYFQDNDTLWEQYKEGNIEFEFTEDAFAVMRDNYNYNHRTTLDEIVGIIEEDNGQNIESFGITCEETHDYGEFTLYELEEKYPDIFNKVSVLLDGLTESDITADDDTLAKLFDCFTDYPTDVIREKNDDGLTYWTIYFKPDYEDVDVASKVGLLPFKYDGDLYLALGGCGMDLSPKLDAYVALTSGVIPSNSKFFSDRNYFSYVVGKEAMTEIEKKCKLRNKKVIVMMYTYDSDEETEKK